MYAVLFLYDIFYYLLHVNVDYMFFQQCKLMSIII